MLRDLTSADLEASCDAGMKKSPVVEEKTIQNEETTGDKIVDKDQPDGRKKCYFEATIIPTILTIIIAGMTMNDLARCTDPYYVFILLTGICVTEAMTLFVTIFFCKRPEAPGLLAFRIAFYVVGGTLCIWFCIGVALLCVLYQYGQCNSDTFNAVSAMIFLSCFGSFPMLWVIYPLVIKESQTKN